MSPTRWNLPVRLDSAFDKVGSEAHMHSKVIKGPGRLFCPNEKCPVRSPSTVIEMKRPDFMDQRRRTNMPSHQEVCFTATREHVYQFPGVEHTPRNPVLEQEQSVVELRAAVESLQQIVCDLLLRNQILRMALDRDREIAATSSAKGFPSGQSRNSR
jgi:hypothetical protein